MTRGRAKLKDMGLVPLALDREVAVTGPMVRAILAAIRRLRAPPLCA